LTESIGAELTRAREERGLSISDVAQQLKFAPRQLEALEQDRFEQLPGGTFARGMVRSYARLLKIEPDPLLDRIAGRFAAPDAGTLAARYSQPVPFSDNARRSTFVYLGLSLGVLVVAGGIAYSWYRDHRQANQLAATKRPAQAAAKAAAPAPRGQPKVVEVAEAPEPVPAPKVQQVKVEPAPAKVTPAGIDTAAITPTSAVPAPKPTAAKPAAEKAATAKVVAPLTGASNRVVIRCDEEAWIEVKDANDRMLVSSLNPRGAERVVRARGPLTLVIGNPAQVHVLHNDRAVDLTPHVKSGVARLTIQ
jgi:cytoskeleton protein RodZ